MRAAPSSFREIPLKPGDIYAERYRIDDLLGRGGMGEVWAARDIELERPIALKLIKREYAELPDYARRFRREMKAIAKLHHPGIVRLYNAGLGADGRLYMDMERIHGITLREAIDTSRRLDRVSAIFYAIQVADALEAAHCAGIWHRDIKPENVMVQQDGRAHTLDFGIAIDAGRPSTGRSRRERRDDGLDSLLMGTVRYMAPETIQNMPVDHRADLYSLGVMLYEMLTGQHPYGQLMDRAGETRVLAAHVHEEPLPFVKLVPELPDELWRVTRKLLEKEPEHRYARAEEVVVALHAVLKGEGTVPVDHHAAKQVAREQLEMERRRAFAKRAAGSAQGDELREHRARRIEEASTAPLPAGFHATSGLPAGFVTEAKELPERTTLELPANYAPPPEQAPFRIAAAKARPLSPPTLRSPPSSTGAVTAPVSFVATPRTPTLTTVSGTAERRRFAMGAVLGLVGGGAVVGMIMMGVRGSSSQQAAEPEPPTPAATPITSETPTAIVSATTTPSATSTPSATTSTPLATPSASAKPVVRLIAKPAASAPMPAESVDQDAPPKRRRIF